MSVKEEVFQGKGGEVFEGTYRRTEGAADREGSVLKDLEGLRSRSLSHGGAEHAASTRPAAV